MFHVKFHFFSETTEFLSILKNYNSQPTSGGYRSRVDGKNANALCSISMLRLFGRKIRPCWIFGIFSWSTYKKKETCNGIGELFRIRPHSGWKINSFVLDDKSALSKNEYVSAKIVHSNSC